MAITKTDSRQGSIFASVPFTYADFTSGVYSTAVELPQGAVVLGGFVVIDTAFNSLTSDTITVGDAVDEDRYKAGIDGTAEALTALVPTGLQYTTQDDLTVTWTGVGTAPTAGAGRLVVEYFVAGRAKFTQG